jgi:TonB-dependent receptor
MQSRNTTVRLMLGASLAALAVSTLPSAGFAQTQGNASVSDENSVSDVIVVGARLAEQAASERKKRSATVQDSIVADDVGQFPDKSVGEAIARIAGVALDVADSGESQGFTIRGQEADLIRVEVDGMTLLDNTGGQNGRQSQFNDLSSDLIKSVDVIKGQTADMTPGGVGGTVRIEQRNGLDFRKPLVKLNLQASNNSLNSEWTPRVNLVAAGKIMDGRLGLLLNATYDNSTTTSDYARVADKTAGYIPFGDWDNSAEKTFTTPYDPRAAAVTTKSDCAFLPTASADGTGKFAGMLRSPINSRLNCYAQWEDWMPSLVRFGRQTREDEKLSFQLRADFRVSDNLTVFASLNPNVRKVHSQDYNLSVATPTGSTNEAGVRTTNYRALAVNENHYVTEYAFVRAGATAADIPGGPVASATNPTVATLNYSSQTREIERNQKQMLYQTGADFEWNKWRGQARLQFSDAEVDRQDFAYTIQAPLDYATFTMDPISGVWSFEPVAAAGVDITSPQAFYAQVNTTTGISPNSQFEYTPQADKSNELNTQLDMTRNFDDGEAGIFTRFKFGVQRREFNNETWREGGAFFLGNGVTQGRARALDQIRACQAPSLTPVGNPPVAPCTLGSVPTPGRGISDQNYQTHSLTPAQYNALMDATVMDLPGKRFFDGVPDRGNLFDTWTVFDMPTFRREIAQYIDTSKWNLDCLYECIANDGNVYDKRSYATKEVTSSAYAMLDFESSVLGMPVQGNVGVRYQAIDVEAQTVVVLQNRTAVAGTGGTAPNTFPTYNIVDTPVKAIESLINRSSRDVLPSFNLSVWPIEDKLAVRYSIAQQRARPRLTELTGTSVVTCSNVDEAQRDALEAFLALNPGAIQDTNPDTDDASEAAAFLNNYIDSCSGTVGNPSLVGYGALTQNLSVEWYPNRDTQVSFAAYKIAVRTDRPEGVRDPEYVIEGNPYSVNTYEDGAAGKDTTGLELTVKTAFTFLPGILRHTGGQFNTSTAKSKGGNQSRDIDRLTGLILPPVKESSFYHNISLWYDDGRVNARVAYQTRDVYFQELRVEGANRVPSLTTPGINGLGDERGSGATSYFKVANPAFRSKTNSLDARASFNVTDKIQIFVEGKNLLDDTQYKHTPHEYREIAPETTYRWDNTYVGRRYYAGVTYTF